MKHEDYLYQMPLDPILNQILGYIQEHKVLNAMQVCRLINQKEFGYCTRTAHGKDQTARLDQTKLVDHCKKECGPTYWQVKTKLDQLVRKGLLMMLKTRFWDGNISGKRTDVFTFYFEKLEDVQKFMDSNVLEVYEGRRV